MRDLAMEIYNNLVNNPETQFAKEMKQQLRDYIAGKEKMAFDINTQMNGTNCDERIKECFNGIEEHLQNNRYNESNISTFALDFVEYP